MGTTHEGCHLRLPALLSWDWMQEKEGGNDEKRKRFIHRYGFA
jgi:hypothetical protein